MKKMEYAEQLARMAATMLARIGGGLHQEDFGKVVAMTIVVTVETGKSGQKAVAAEISDGACNCPKCFEATVRAIARQMGGEIEVETLVEAALGAAIH